jgi:hypothetical protein
MSRLEGVFVAGVKRSEGVVDQTVMSLVSSTKIRLM